jgi:2-keto-4-pentenoate hydratase/2-oxohepta-3-ene-1,7-dioic acid hydratase in catechol pathway
VATADVVNERSAVMPTTRGRVHGTELAIVIGKEGRGIPRKAWQQYGVGSVIRKALWGDVDPERMCRP